MFERTGDVTSINLPAQNPPLQGTLSSKLGFNGSLGINGTSRGGTGGSAASAGAVDATGGGGGGAGAYAPGATGAGLLASPGAGAGAGSGVGSTRLRHNVVASREGISSAGDRAHGGVEPLGRLTAVRSIYLSRNFLSGALPGEAIARLRLLTTLNLRQVCMYFVCVCTDGWMDGYRCVGLLLCGVADCCSLPVGLSAWVQPV